MSVLDCICTELEELNGPAMQLYISDLLERIATDEATAEAWYQCRCCATLWKQPSETNSSKPSLVRLAAESNV
jgi:hypothetical protein